MTILSMATNRPLPDVGPGHERLTLIFDLVLLALTVALVVTLRRLPGWYRRSARRGISSSEELVRRIITVSVVSFTLSVVLSYLAFVPMWKAAARFQPDLVYWLYAVATLLFVKGALEIALLRRIFGSSRRSGPSVEAGAQG